MSETYDNFAKFYDLEYSHKENDLDFYLDLADRYGDPILEVGAGTGRVAFDLAAAGYTVYGIDNSVQMLESANAKLSTFDNELEQRVSLTLGDMRHFNLDQKFPLCIAPFRTFLHNLTMDDQLATLKSVKKHLLPGGVFAFDLFVPLYTVMAQNEWRDKIESDELADPDSGMSIEIEVKHQPKDQLLTIRNSYYDKNQHTETAEMQYRYIFRYEMEMLLRLAGFRIIKVFGGFENQSYDYESGIMVFVAALINK